MIVYTHVLEAETCIFVLSDLVHTSYEKIQ